LVEKRFRLHFPKALMTVGAATYSIYLVHSPVISILAFVNHRFAAGYLPGPILFAIVAAISVAVGVAFHLYVEKRVLAWLRRRPSEKPASVSDFGVVGAK